MFDTGIHLCYTLGMSKISDNLIDRVERGEVLDNYEEHELHDEWDKNCSECYKLCKVCLGRGYVMKTEWVDTDSSYDKMERCECTYD